MMHFLEFPTSAGKLGKTKTACKHANIVWFHMQLTFNLAPSVLISQLLHYISVYRVWHLNRFGLKHTQTHTAPICFRCTQVSVLKKQKPAMLHMRIPCTNICTYHLKVSPASLFFNCCRFGILFFPFLLKCFTRSVRKGNMNILSSGNRTFVNTKLAHKVKLCN